jgi:hypothetical protein
MAAAVTAAVLAVLQCLIFQLHHEQHHHHRSANSKQQTAAKERKRESIEDTVGDTLKLHACSGSGSGSGSVVFSVLCSSLS